MVSGRKKTVGKLEKDSKPLRRKSGSLSCKRHYIIRLFEVEVILGKDALPFISPVAFQNDAVKRAWAVKLPLAWTQSEPRPPQKRK